MSSSKVYQICTTGKNMSVVLKAWDWSDSLVVVVLNSYISIPVLYLQMPIGLGWSVNDLPKMLFWGGWRMRIRSSWLLHRSLVKLRMIGVFSHTPQGVKVNQLGFHDLPKQCNLFLSLWVFPLFGHNQLHQLRLKQCVLADGFFLLHLSGTVKSWISMPKIFTSIIY